jgi:hypothetical protein
MILGGGGSAAGGSAAGGEYAEGDYGCVVYPGLSTSVNPLLVVSKTFKDIGEKRREEYIEKVFGNLLSFLSIFRWVLEKKRFKGLNEGVYRAFKVLKEA